MGLILDLLYPPRCAFCHRFLDNGKEPVCDECGKRVLREETIFRQLGIAQCFSPLEYKDEVRDSLQRFKFGGCVAYADLYAALMAACLVREETAQFDLITWVPVSTLRKMRRGYDQCALLAKALSRILKIPAKPCLKKVRNNRPQSKTKDKKQRAQNVANVFALRRGCEISGQRVLLLDDIITTGSTLKACCRLLKKAGAAKLLCCTVASV